MRLLPLLFLPFAYIHAFSRITSAPENKQLMASKPIIVGSTKPIENFDPLKIGRLSRCGGFWWFGWWVGVVRGSGRDKTDGHNH